jgi:xanthine dehydrogenase accessory factor
MNHSLQLYRMLIESLIREEGLALATVISRTGSGPREAGASMLISDRGTFLGTVGGGSLEVQVLKLAHEAVRAARSVRQTFVLTKQAAARDGMICGGRVDVLVDYLNGAAETWRDIIEQALRVKAAGRPCWLIRSIREIQCRDPAEMKAARLPSPLTEEQEGGATGLLMKRPVQTGLGLLEMDDLNAGSLDVSELNREMLHKERRRGETRLICGPNIRYLIQPVGSTEKVIIAGAGHVALELAPLCNIVGFRTVMIDDRPDFANAERFPAADEIVVPPSFQQSLERVQVDEDSYVVIVTRGHEHDRTVLAQALRTGAGYIGMIGSRKKRDAIYRMILDEGFTPEDIARVHCPIGLAIGAQTPEEIAVSIVAELIAVRHGKGKSFPGPL